MSLIKLARNDYTEYITLGHELGKTNDPEFQKRFKRYTQLFPPEKQAKYIKEHPDKVLKKSKKNRLKTQGRFQGLVRKFRKSSNEGRSAMYHDIIKPMEEAKKTPVSATTSAPVSATTSAPVKKVIEKTPEQIAKYKRIGKGVGIGLAGLAVASSGLGLGYSYYKNKQNK